MGAIVVTGASTGIGRATALTLVAGGHRVFAGVRKVADGQALVAAAASDRLVPLILDVTDERGIGDAAEVVRGLLGDEPLTGLVNNAGIGVGGPVEHLSLDTWRRQFEVNVFGQVAVTRAFIPFLRRAPGRIVNVTSMGGRIGQPFMAPYSASKFALEAITDSLRLELSPWGIDVIAVEPGAIRTEIWAKARSAFDQVREALGPEGREQYAGGIDAVERFVNLASSRAVPPERVAAVIDRALHGRWPKARYPVGVDAHVGIFLREWLPDRLWDQLILRA